MRSFQWPKHPNSTNSVKKWRWLVFSNIVSIPGIAMKEFHFNGSQLVFGGPSSTSQDKQ